MTLEDDKNIDASLVPASSIDVIKVLHIDDDENVQMFLKVFIESDPNIKITSVQSAEEAIRLVRTDAYDCFISDYDMPGMDGITLAGKIREISDIPIIIYTGRGSEEVAERAFAVGVDDYIRKEETPAHYQLVSKRIRHAVERRKAEKALRESEERYRALVDNSPYAISVTVGDKIVYANRTRAQLVGVDDPSKLIGTSSQLQISEADRKIITERINMRASGERLISPFTFQLVSENGSVRDVEDYNLEITYGGEKAVQHMLIDVTEHKLFSRRLEALHTIELELIEVKTMDEVAELSLDAIEHILGFDQCDFAVVEDDMLHFHHVRGIEGVVDLPLSGGGITVRAVRTGETQFVTDVRLDGDYVKTTRGEYKALSEVVVPVKIGDDVVAVLNVESSKINAYTDEDVKLLEILSEHVTSAIQRNKLLESMRSYTISLEALQHHALELSKCEDINAVAKTTYTILHEIMGFSFFGLGIVEGNVLKFVSSIIDDKDWGLEYPLDGSGICGRAVKTGSTIIVPDVRLDPDYIGPKSGPKYLSELVVPIKIGDKVVAVINVEDKAPSRFTRDDIMLLEIFTEHVASSLNRIELLEKTRKHLARIEQINRHATHIAELNSEREVAEYSFNVIDELLGFGDGCIGVVEGDALKFKYARNLDFQIPDLPLSGTGITIRAYKTGKSQLVKDTRLDPDFVKAFDPAEFLSELDVPVKVDGGVVAVINLEDRRLGFFNEEDREIVEILAENVASALQRINMLESTRRHLSRLSQINVHATHLARLNSVEEVAEYSFDVIGELIGFEDGCIGVVEGDVLSFKYARNPAATLVPSLPLDGGGITVRAYRTGKSQLVADTRLDDDFVKDVDPQHLSELDVPVSIDGRVVAVINLEHQRPSFFGEEDREIVEILAEQLASTISRINHIEVIRESEEALLRSEERFKYLLDSAPEGVTVNILGKIVYVNQHFAEMIGYSVQELLQKNIVDLHNESYKKQAEDKTRRRALGGQVPNQYGVELIRKDGSVLPVEYSVSRINFNGEMASLTFIRDVTQRREKIELEKKIESLHTHARVLNDLQSIDEVANATLELLHTHLNCNLLSIRLVIGDYLHPLANWGRKSTGKKMKIQGKGVVARAAREKRSMLVPDTRVDPDFVRGSSESLSELVVPILCGDEMLGVLNAESLTLGAFHENDQVLMETLADEVGSAITRIKALESERTYNSKLEALHVNAIKLSQARTIDEALNTTCEILQSSFGYNWVGVGRVGEEAIKYVRVLGIGKVGNDEIPLDRRSITTRAVRSGETQLVPDTSKDEDYIVVNPGDTAAGSELVVPIRVNGRVEFVVNIESVKLNAFSDQDQHLVELLSSYLGSAVELIMKRDKLNALHLHASHLEAASDIEDIAKMALDTLSEVLDFKISSFHVIEENAIEVIANIGFKGEGRFPQTLNGRGLVPYAMRECRSVYAPDIAQDEHYVKSPLVMGDERSSAFVVPITIGGAPVAAIYLEDRRIDGFSDEDRRLVELLSIHVASAMQRIELFKSQRRHTLDLEALQRHAANLLETSTIEEVMRCTFDIIEKVLSVTDGAIGFVEGNTLTFPYAKNVSADQLPVLRLDGAGISVRAIRTGETQLVYDTRSDPDFVTGYGGSLSELDVPVKVGGRVVAVINLEDPRPHAFSEEDRKVVEILSEHVASAIQRIAHYEIIRNSEERYRKVLDSSFDGVIMLSETRIIYANRSLSKLLGYDNPPKLIGLDASAIIPEDKYENLKQRTLRRQSGEPLPSRYNLELLRKDGKTVEVEADVTLTEFDGKPAALAVLRDVSESKRFERQMIALRDHAYTLSEASSIEDVCQVTLDAVESVIGFHLGSFLVVEGGDLTSIGNRGSPTFGKPIPIAGRGITAKAARRGAAVLVRDVREDPDFLQGTSDSLSELAVPVILEGETIAMLNFESFELNAFNEVDQRLLETFAVHVSSAIYRIREMDRLRKQEAEKSKELMSGAEKIVSMVRHDLRNPLQMIQNASYFLRHKYPGAEEYTNKIDSGVEYAAKILEDLKTMMGPTQLKKESIDFNDLVKSCLGNVSFPSSINLDARYGAPMMGEADSYKIRRVVDNLVKNAVEAMPGGGTLSVKVEAAEGMAILTVGDTGQGIPEDVARSLFTPFYTTKPSGTGLGLVICKQIVEAHGGRITFESCVGEGTTFTVTLPLSSRVISDEETSVPLSPLNNHAEKGAKTIR